MLANLAPIPLRRYATKGQRDRKGCQKIKNNKTRSRNFNQIISENQVQ